MKIIRTALLACCLSVPAGASHAALIQSSSAIGEIIPTRTVSLDLFDSSLGTLTGIELFITDASASISASGLFPSTPTPGTEPDGLLVGWRCEG